MEQVGGWNCLCRNSEWVVSNLRTAKWRTGKMRTNLRTRNANWWVKCELCANHWRIIFWWYLSNIWWRILVFASIVDLFPWNSWKNIFHWILFEYSNNVHVKYKFVDSVVFIYLMENILLRASFSYSNKILKKIIISYKYYFNMWIIFM